MTSPLFRFEHVDLQVAEKMILSDLTFEIEEGQRLTLVGPSGSGKSSILKLLAGLTSASKGHLSFEGTDLSDLDMPQYRREVSYCFQQPVLFGETVEDNLAFPFLVRGLDFDSKKALEALNKVNLGQTYLKHQVKDLSGGEKQRVALVRNMLFEPRVLLLDEISTGLDASTKSLVHEVISSYHRSGKTIVEVTHDQEEISSAINKLTIEGGRIHA